MTEVGVLTLCFVLTFGLLGYKLKGVIAKILDNYSRKIEDDINHSEQLKKQAVYALDEAEKEEIEIGATITDMQHEYLEKMALFEKQMKEKMDKNVEKLLISHRNRLQNDKEELLIATKDSIVKSIMFCVDEYIKTKLNNKQNDDVRLKMLTRINFKRLFE